MKFAAAVENTTHNFLSLISNRMMHTTKKSAFIDTYDGCYLL